MEGNVDQDNTLIIKNRFPDQELRGWLILLDGKGKKTKSFELIKPLTTIGRDSGNDIVLDDKTVSRAHCCIQIIGPDTFIIEENSRNGIYLDDYPVANGKLTNGTTIRLGQSILIAKLI